MGNNIYIICIADDGLCLHWLLLAALATKASDQLVRKCLDFMSLEVEENPHSEDPHW